MSESEIRSLTPLKTYISALIENLDKEKIPKNIDLILDGGAFNGAFAYGMLIYLKELEKLKLLKIDKISGTSIGAILGVIYLTNNIDNNIGLFENLLNAFRETIFLDKMSNLLRELVNKYVSNVEDLNDRLFITYYDVNTMQQIVINKYKSKEELIEILIRSSYIPYLTNGNLKYDDKYCDGFTPYVFPKSNKKVLFIYLMSYKKLKSAVFTKNEVNIWSRLLNGVVDINNFFSESDSVFCSYINNWSVFDFSTLRLREIIVVILCLLVKSYLFVNQKLPDNIKNNIYLSRMQKILVSLYKDIFSYMVI